MSIDAPHLFSAIPQGARGAVVEPMQEIYALLSGSRWRCCPVSTA